MSAVISSVIFQLLKREEEEGDGEGPDTSEREIKSSWALFIMIMLLITALFTSYMLQQKKVEAVHETVISIFAGMTVGLILRVSSGTSIQNLVTFDYQIFFNLLLPPIILASGYELHQANFFRNIGTILTFAFAGTFISAIVLGVVLWVYTRIPIDVLDMTFVDAISVGATLSATDPVTILAIFNTYKVDPKLYTIIFGEAILNDAVAIVLFETAQQYKEGSAAGTLGFVNLIEGIGIFLAVFFGSLLIGVAVGMSMALTLKYTYVRRFPKIESCLIVLVAYASYFFSNGLHMSGIVTLLFCGITLKHYAYYNMSRRTQLTTKYLFQVLAQLSENFIFIYLGLSLFTESKLEYKPLFIIVTVIGICIARWAAVFPLSMAINWFIRYRSKRKGKDVADELPYNYQAMLFWAGLRGAVGVALAAGMTGQNAYALKATVLVVVVLTVIIFGGTTARMLEILGIRTGVVEEIDSDDEFDIESHPGGSYYKNSGASIGHAPKRNVSVALQGLQSNGSHRGPERGSYASGNSSPHNRPSSLSRKGSQSGRRGDHESEQELLRPGSGDDSDMDSDTSDLPPAVKRSPSGRTTVPESDIDSPYPTSGSSARDNDAPALTASGAISQLLHGTAEDHAAWFRQLDEGFIKPKLLLDGGKGPHHGGPSGS
ncbi:Sodium exchanger [Venustampulla echinocandica]|uniref:Sodium/hydrogen exchanger n=1 Tax=Venustampulla echinocandica TaxID=2656787 RepID=A0A370TUY6_9HELO|nr:Sodium exchanger [Venustampulla echinocandica]RDL39310.1 Sodium exchanger [Venustampulla echinocandica]